MRRISYILCFVAALVVPAALAAGEAAPAPKKHTVRIMLVKADAPEQSLRGITRELPEVKRQRIGAATHWPAHIHLNGEPVFERYESGQLTVRLPIRTIELAAGEYLTDPGNHRFTIGDDGKIATDDPEMLVKGADIRLKCYPVTIQVVDGEEPGAFSVRRLPGAFTVTKKRTVKVPKPKKGEPTEKIIDVQLVPEAGSFQPLTFYLPTNTIGEGYRVKPYGVTFHVAGGKVKLVAREGQPLTAESTGLEIGIPTRPIAVSLHTVPNRPVRAQMKGINAEQPLALSGAPRWRRPPKLSANVHATIVARAEPVELIAGGKATSLRTRLDCTFAKHRYMALHIDNSLLEMDAARLFMMEYTERALAPRQWNEVRLGYVDATIPTLTDPQVAAFVHPTGAEKAEWRRVEVEKLGEFAALQLTEPPQPEVKSAGEQDEGPQFVNPQSASFRLRLPALPMGVYDLRVALASGTPTADAKLAVTRLVVVVPPNVIGALGFFTQKGRDAFQLGEDIRIGLAAKSDRPLPSGAPVVTLTGPNGSEWKASLSQPAASAKQATFFVRLTRQVTRNLSPGRYELRATWGSLLPAAKSIDLVDPCPETHFLSVMPGKYSALGGNYHRALRSDFEDPDGAEELVQYADRIGHNQIDLMHYSTDRTKRFPSIQEQVYAQYPTMPPAEAFYRPTPRDRILNEAVRRGIGVNDTLITFNDNHAPRYNETLLRCTERWVALETQSLKHSPATRGLTFYDELYAIAITVPGGQQEAFQRFPRIAFEEKHGVAPAQLVKDIARFTERPKKRRDVKALEGYLSWYRFLEEGWADMNRRLQKASKRVLPSLRNTTRHRVWGTPGYTLDGEHGYWRTVLDPLDIAGLVTYSDNAGGWPLTHAMMADAYGCHPQKPRYLTIPFAISADNGEYLQQNFFSGLSQGIHGAAFYAQPGLDPNEPWRRVAEGNRDLFQGIIRRYGDLFLKLEPAYKQVAIYHSWRAQMLSPHKELASVAHKTEGLWISCLRAGFPADFILDEDLLNGRPLDYRVILVPGIEFEQELSEPILAKLRSLIAAGKTVVVEKGSKLDLEGVVMMDNTEWDEFYQPLYQSAGWDHELQKTFDLTEALTAKMKDLLSRYVRPAADHSMTVGPDWLRHGDTWYLVVPNFEDPMFTYLHRQRLVAPTVQTLRLYDKPDVCYDVLEMARVKVRKEGEALAIDADLRHSSGKLYAFMKRPIGGIALACTASPKPGGDLVVRVRVMDDSGEAIEGALPIELKLLDPKGRETARYRAAAPAVNEVLRIPANAAGGNWTLTARELIAGHEAKHEFTLSAPQPPTTLAEDTRKVLVHDPSLLKRILPAMKKVVVPIEDASSPVARMIERLKPAFKARGIELSVVQPAAVAMENEVYRKEGVYNEYSHWDRRLVGPTFHVDSPVLLLDLAGTHPWMGHLIRHGLMLDVPSKHNPGPGRAIVVPVPHAFHTREDTIVISSGDVAGLELGLKALLSLDKAGGVAYPPPLPAEAPTAADLKETKGSAVRHTSTRRLAHLENIVTSIAVDPQSGRIFVGTRGYGDNLFCLDANGSRAWSRYLSEYHVHRVEATPDGRHVFASCLYDDRTYLLDAADGTIRWSLVNVPKKRIARNHEGYASSYAHPRIFPQAKKLVIYYKDGAAIVGFDGKLVQHVTLPRKVSGPAFSPDVTHFAIVTIVDHKETYQPPPVRGKPRPPMEIAAAYDHLRIHRVSDGQQVADTVLGKASGGHYRVAWPSAQGPVARRAGKELQFDVSGKELKTIAIPLTKPEPYDVDEDGVLHAFSDDGKERWHCSVADPTPDTGGPGDCALTSLGEKGVVVGTSRGRVIRIDGNGKTLWRAWLGEMNEPAGDYASFVREGRRENRDVSAGIWPTIMDQDGDLDAKVKMGINRLANPSFESETGGWTVDGDARLPRLNQAQHGKYALRVGEKLVSQDITQHVCRMATYVLEFHYRPLRPRATLVAGTLIDGGERVPSSVSFHGEEGQWHFGRLATKTYDNTNSLAIGFFAEGGEVLVDNVRLRQVRWPSANYMQNLAVHKIKPLWVESFRIAYRGVPERVKDQLTNKVYVPILPAQGGRAVFIDGALLQNGRLNDTKSTWYMYEAPTYVELVWQKPAWVSHLALYFHQHHPEWVTQSFFVSCIDSETKKWTRFAHVEGNRQLFFVLKFKPIFTDRIRIEEDMVHPRQRTLTEIEAYGPLGGEETAAGFSKDPDAFAMYMGGPDHVGRRKVPDLVGEFKFKAANISMPTTDRLIAASTGTPAAIVDGRFYMASNHGHVVANDLAKLNKEPAISRPTRWGLLTWPTIYGGRMIVGGAGGQVHCLRADNAELLYQARTGGRVYAAPLPNGDDLFVASMDGSLYKLDIANGSILWSVELGGELRASPAFANGVVVAVSTEAKVVAVDAALGKARWTTEIAPESVGSPAIDGGRVYVGDRAGVVQCLALGNGKPIWKREIGRIIETCPTVTKGSIFVVNLDGELIRLNKANGSIVWRQSVGANNQLESAATDTQILAAIRGGIRVLRQADGKPDERFVCNGQKGLVPMDTSRSKFDIVGFCVYRGSLYTTHYPEKGGPIFLNQYGWAQRSTTLGVASPAPAEKGKR